MYKTENGTNNSNSAVKANTVLSPQYDFFADENNSHDPDALIIEKVFEHYYDTQKESSDLAQELINRKIDPCYIDQFKIGVSNRTLGFELLSAKCLLGSRNRGHLQRLGLLKETGHEFFQGAMVVPYFNDKRKIIGAYGRRIKHQSRSSTYHVYWNSQHVPLFNSPREKWPEDLTLCKSAFDALTLLSAGFQNAVATMGIKGFNEHQLSMLLEKKVKRVFVAFDNTPSGNHYGLLVAQALNVMGISCYRIKLPRGQDVNSFAMSQQDVAGSFDRLLDTAMPFNQCYEGVTSRSSHCWLDTLITLDDCIQFYLEESQNLGRSSRMLNNCRIHLERFQKYCRRSGIEKITELTNSVLESYQLYLQKEANLFTGNLISLSTQMERMDAVSRMLVRLHYFGVIPRLLSFVHNQGEVH